MTKSDLKDWMVVETRDGVRFLVCSYQNAYIGHNEYFREENYNEDLTHKYDHDLDIVCVYKIINPFGGAICLNSILELGNLIPIWEREEPPVEMTIAEIEKKLGIKNLKIVKEGQSFD